MTLPFNVRKSNKEQSSKAQLESCLDANSKIRNYGRLGKHSQVGCIDVPTETSRVKKKKRTSRTKYYKMVKRNQRGKAGVLAKECAAKAITRKKPGVLAKECAAKAITRKKPGILAKECAAKAITRKKPGILAKECAAKAITRKKRIRCISKRMC